ncbi:MAG TPA: hypothetical protein VL500_05390, partial [Candidatus Eisenbacteria bacterium]|nr:hypothetical protein [Candidatus Eisenbacteria bacterium]
WFHACFIVCAVLSGLALPLLVVIVAVIVHRLHMVAFDGCLLTAIERRFGALPRDLTVLQHAARRFSGKAISSRQSARLDKGFVALCLALAVAHHLLSTVA